MPKTHAPRHGSMQVWPRKRARREYARIRGWPESKEAKALGFAGYKVGMTHIFVTDNRKNSITKGEDISIPVTVIECPPLRIASVRFYKNANDGKYGTAVASEISNKTSKDLARRLPKSKKEAKLDDFESKLEEFSDITITVYTQPRLTGIGKKKPEVFEVHLGGSIQDKFAFAKDNLTKEIPVDTVFNEGDLIDIHSVTKGKGTQGPVKRFGVDIRPAKSEKTKRGPGSLGSWKGQGHMMYRIAFAGQTGYHTRTDYNKKIMMIGKDSEKINPKGGFIRYGLVKNTYLLVKGSIGGATKRLIRFKAPIRPNSKYSYEAPDITHISTASKQGR